MAGKQHAAKMLRSTCKMNKCAAKPANDILADPKRQAVLAAKQTRKMSTVQHLRQQAVLPFALQMVWINNAGQNGNDNTLNKGKGVLIWAA